MSPFFKFFNCSYTHGPHAKYVTSCPDVYRKGHKGVFGLRKQLFSSSTHFKNAVKIWTTLPLLMCADELKSRFVPCLIMHLSSLGNAVQQCTKGYCKQLTGAYHALLKNVLQNLKKVILHFNLKSSMIKYITSMYVFYLC